ncbi:MAG TPA: NUDIX hydrolase [Candidatus Absconditabacterales bacterium]|nr:NUDIX hydrolase [Candidatus Absconditabacterales bacterium]
MNIFNLPIGIVFDEAGHILLLKRIDRGTWEPVKGAIDEGETPEEAIKREFLEETGIDKAMIIEFENRGVSSETKELESGTLLINRYFFVFRVAGIKPIVSINHIIEGGEDHDAYGWYTMDEIKSLNIEYKESFIETLNTIKF